MVLERTFGAAAFAASGTMLGWGAVRGRFDWVIEEVPVRLARLPKVLDGFTIVQISDIHVGVFVRDRELALGLGLVARARPDFIVITGDIVDSDATYVESPRVDWGSYALVVASCAFRATTITTPASMQCSEGCRPWASRS